MAAGVSLREHLHGQLHVMPLSQRDQFLTALVVESLDDDGYLRMNLSELLPLSELEPAADMDELKVALRMVQSLEPAGVGARDLRECLKLQTVLIENEAERALAERVLDQPSRAPGHAGCRAAIARPRRRRLAAGAGVRSHPSSRPPPGLALRCVTHSST